MTFSDWNDPVTVSAPANTIGVDRVAPLFGRGGHAPNAPRGSSGRVVAVREDQVPALLGPVCTPV